MPEISSIAFKIATTEVLHQHHDIVANIICCLHLNPEITERKIWFFLVKSVPGMKEYGFIHLEIFGKFFFFLIHLFQTLNLSDEF